jgi:hypothetical protein
MRFAVALSLTAMAVSLTRVVAADLVECDACVAISTELCKAALKHNEKLGEHPTDRRQNKEREDGKYVTPMPIIVEAAIANVCEIPHLRYYTHPPPLLQPACVKFLERHRKEVQDFFEVFHRKGISCRAAVDIMCASTTRVCYDYDVENVVAGGTETVAYTDPVATKQRGGGGPLGAGGDKRSDADRPKAFLMKDGKFEQASDADIQSQQEKWDAARRKLRQERSSRAKPQPQDGSEPTKGSQRSQHSSSGSSLNAEDHTDL